ncbi:MAG: hypothetical protein WDZ41_03590 [Candidatus Babeliales bacterium]
MRYYIFFLLVLFGININSKITDYSLVFVHVGPVLPSYTKFALEQARLFNPEAPIYLIINKNAKKDERDNFIISTNNIITIFCEELHHSKEHQEFNENSSLNNSWREGFWRKATERFFYLDELISQLNLEHVIHLETDVMLYVNISDIFHALKRYKGIAAIFDNDNRCIPSFLYIPTKQMINTLVSFIAYRAKQGFNDMEILAHCKEKYGKEFIDFLPIIIPDYVHDHELKNQLGQKVVNSDPYHNYFDEFKSIFDGAALGQYLGGIDPRNGQSLPGFINESCIFNPSHFIYEWEKDWQGRKVPFLTYKNKKYRINNLHIHSKKLDEFKS